jgi:hypothetical protein
MPSPSQILVDWCQVISAVLGLVALVVALFAVAKAKRDLVTERRVTHELDVLRSIADALRSFGSSSLVQLMRTYLQILPGYTDFPIARAEFDVRGSDPARQQLATLKLNAQPSPIEQYHATQEFLDLYRTELGAAIKIRVREDRRRITRSVRDRHAD